MQHDIDAIREGAAELGLISLDGRIRAATGDVAIAQIPAGARVARRHQLETRGQKVGAVDAHDADRPILERLPEHLQRV